MYLTGTGEKQGPTRGCLFSFIKELRMNSNGSFRIILLEFKEKSSGQANHKS